MLERELETGIRSEKNGGKVHEKWAMSVLCLLMVHKTYIRLSYG